MFNRRASWPWNERFSWGLRGAKVLLQRMAYERLWKQRLETYQRKLAITQFSADWTKEYWGTSCEVLYPPVQVDFTETAKVDRVVALGRFTPMKKQLEIVGAFRNHVVGALPGWSISCMGGLGSSKKEDQRYFEEVHALAGDSPAIQLHPNVARETSVVCCRVRKFFGTPPDMALMRNRSRGD